MKCLYVDRGENAIEPLRFCGLPATAVYVAYSPTLYGQANLRSGHFQRCALHPMPSTEYRRLTEAEEAVLRVHTT